MTLSPHRSLSCSRISMSRWDGLRHQIEGAGVEVHVHTADLVALLDERDSLERRLEAEATKVWVPVREMPGHVIRQLP